MQQKGDGCGVSLEFTLQGFIEKQPEGYFQITSKSKKITSKSKRI